MALQNGLVQLSGTIGDVTHYRRNGKNFSRKKSSLTNHKIKTLRSFAPTRQLNDQMKLASPTASFYYQSLSQGSKNIKVYRKMVAVAQHLLAEGKSIEEVHATLKKMRDKYENVGSRIV
jgi:hypothetical protein